MCKLLGVSRSGYYAYASRPKSKSAIENEVISDYIKSYRSFENHTIIKPGNFVPISYYDPENQAANVNAESFDKNVRKKTKRLLENIKRFK